MHYFLNPNLSFEYCIERYKKECEDVIEKTLDNITREANKRKDKIERMNRNAEDARQRFELQKRIYKTRTDA